MLKQLLKNLRIGFPSNELISPEAVRQLIRRGEYDAAERQIAQLAAGSADEQALRLCLLGETAFKQEKDVEAEAHFRSALKLAPGMADAHCGLSLILHVQSRQEEALQHAQFAANKGDVARYHAQLGLCQLAQGNHLQADSALARATRLDPEDHFAWNNLGIARRARGNLAGARHAFSHALVLVPDFAQAAANLMQLEVEEQAAAAADTSTTVPGITELSGTALLSEIDQAELDCTAQPDDPALAARLFGLYKRAGDSQSGLDVLEAFLSRHPEDVETQCVLGCAYAAAEEYRLAKPLVIAALVHQPNNPKILSALADVRREQGKIAEALELTRRALEADPSLTRKGQLAAMLVNANCFEEALAVTEDILAEDPSKDMELLGLKICAMTYLGMHEQAMPLLDAVIQMSPNEPIRRFPRATIHLLNERFALGWEDYAFRHMSSIKHLRVLALPRWQGESLEGRSILILAEQGLGDQVMFASCIPDVLARNPQRVIIEAVDRIAKTIARSFPACEVVASQQDGNFDWVPGLGEVDCCIALGDLPRLLRRTRESFPAHRGYLVADKARVDHWRRWVDPDDNGPLRVGFSWRGGTEMTRSGMRTMDIALMAPLLRARPVTWVCLQYGDVTADLARPELEGLPVRYAPESIKDLDEFAAVVAGLDLVITVCNTTVHYAGALGKPVWVMAPQVPEWRYGVSFESMPWYPSSRMFRQSQNGDWVSILGRIGQELSLVIDSASNNGPEPSA